MNKIAKTNISLKLTTFNFYLFLKKETEINRILLRNIQN